MSSLKDVGRLAGVSGATVSHVVNGTRFVSVATRQAVLAAIDELHYTPNILAKNLKSGSRDTVGFIVPDIANGYFATVIEEIEDVLQANGVRLIIANTREDAARERDSLRMLSSGVVDGLILATTLSTGSDIRANLPNGFPLVLIDRAVDNSDIDVVTTNNFDALSAGVNALVRRGHRAIGFMGSIRHLSTTIERVSAYSAALQQHGIPIEQAHIQFVESFKDPVRPLVDELVEAGCTAIVASNNVLTTRLLAVLGEAVNPAGDIEVLGYRDPGHELYGAERVIWVEEPIAAMGRLAAEGILRRIHQPEADAVATQLQASVLG